MKKFSTKNDPYSEREAQKYSKPIPSREYIMQYLEELGRPATFDNLCRAFSLRADDKQDALSKRLGAMVRDGQVLANRRGSYALVDKLSLVRGLVVGHKDGFGFLISEDAGNDIFLPARQMRAVFSGDRVLVRVVDEKRRGKQSGIVVEVLERNTTRIVGRYFEESGASFVVPANKRITQDIIILPGEEGDAKPGQLVDAEIITYPNLRRQATAKVVEVLGEHMAPGMEIEVAMRTHNLPYIWSEATLIEAAQLKDKLSILDAKKTDGDELIAGRKDLRKLPFVTIDGADARDFDDAVYCKPGAKGGWQLFVAIADVSYYVKPDTGLDQEALLRGNSVYFPSSVVPMLPEILSNELCSLKPNVDRLAMVCEITIDNSGNLQCFAFYEAVICSHARLTYSLAAKMLAGSDKSNAKLLPHLQELHKLFGALERQRVERGAVEFETVETQIIFGENKKIKTILPTERNIAHKIIEECMLAANVCAAKYLLQKKIPALYRVHESPDEERLEKLRNYLGMIGLSLGGGSEPTPKDYALLVQQIKGRPDRFIIQTMLLRSMRQAVYDAENVGHFGLAYDAYGHFTSPIRRYPDLITHRAIRHAIRGGNLQDFYYDNNQVHNFGEHCSMTERRADEAANDVVEWLKCEYMLDKVGKEYDGIISGVCGFGVFVELKEVYVEGLIHITSLVNDYYEFDDVRQCLRGKRTGKKYALGGAVKVLVARVDLDERQLDFELVD
ncbi:MAG: ribonuclease R [Gammaproteobacteria bacterium]|nr:ribonuclease R [Gammaproteobacteria bacterium]